MINNGDIDATMSAMLQVMARYLKVNVARLLEASGKVETTKDIAKDLQTSLMNSWLKDGVTVDNVFEWFKPNIAKSMPISTSDFYIFAAYVALFNKKQPLEMQTSMIAVIRKFYHDESLGPMLEMASREPSTKKEAMILRNQLFDAWVLMPEFTPGLFSMNWDKTKAVTLSYRSYYYRDEGVHHALLMKRLPLREN